MLPADRRRLIVELVEKHSSVSVAELCEQLDVSEMTIRRDLRILSDQGLLQRIHGGAMTRRSRSYEPPFMLRSAAHTDFKQSIAREAARLVREGDSIALDVGTTTLEIARQIVGTRNVTILTSSVPIANILADAPDIHLILTGGIVRKQERSMIGDIAINTYQRFHVDKAFVGIGGLHLQAGLTEYNLEDAVVKRALIDSAERVIVAADSSKLDRTCFASVAGLAKMDVLVTDANAPKEFLQELAQTGIEVIIAPTES